MHKAQHYATRGQARHPLVSWLFGLLGVTSWHWSNENRRGEIRDAAGMRMRTLYGPAWRDGRLWLTWGDADRPGRHRTLGVEWIARHTLCGLFGHWNDEGEICLGFGLRWVGLWLHLDGFRPPTPYLDYGERFYKAHNRDLSVSWHDGGVSWNLWRDDGAWNRAVPKWRHGRFDVRDWLLGRTTNSTQTLRVERALIPLPEGATLATFTFTERTWTRPRWPIPTRIVSCNIAPDRPAAVPGKGENSWDLDDDAIVELSCAATTLEGAIAAYLESVLRDRQRYGGTIAWQPEPAA